MALTSWARVGGGGGKEEGDTHSSLETAQELEEILQNGIRILAFKVELRIRIGFGGLTLGPR